MSSRGPDGTPRPCGRFAPSPTGPLHFGSLIAAVASCCDARARGGRWLVRIEDVDTTRTRPGAADAILATLERYGFRWDGPVVHQSARTALYASAFEQLRAAGAVYECACTRRENALAPVGAGGEHVYPGTCRNGIPEDRRDRAARAWRMRVPADAAATIAWRDRLQGAQSQDLAHDVGDFVVKRADGLFAYQLAVVVDDADQGVTHVVRGADLITSTPRQILLQRTLGLPTPAYLHHPVAIGHDGAKLSKETRAARLPDDPLPALLAAWRFLGQALDGGSAQPASIAEFWEHALASFAPARLPAGHAARGAVRFRDGGRRGSIICGLPGALRPRPPDHNAHTGFSMTTIVAVRKNDEITIAADSLTTFGDTRLTAQYDRTPEKILHYRGNYIGLCGSAAHQLVFESLLAKHADLDFSGKAAIFETFRKLHPILKEQHFLNPKEEEDDPYESTQVTALVANAQGIFGVYSMREVFEYTRFWAVGSGREFAIGAMYALYPKLRSAEAIARAGIDAGAAFDRNSGLPMTLYSVACKP